MLDPSTIAKAFEPTLWICLGVAVALVGVGIFIGWCIWA
jgi:hypothetical protein